VTEDGEVTGAISGGCLERDVGIADQGQVRALTESARSVFASGISSARTLAFDTGSAAACFEIVEPPPQLAIFGGGYDAVPVVALAKAVGARVIVVDARSGYATRSRFPTADRLMAVAPMAAIEALALNGKSMAVVMHHNYREDLAALEALLPTPISYLGVLGPKRRTARLVADLMARGVAVTPAQLAGSLHEHTDPLSGPQRSPANHISFST
jgi:xanthine/CO dehydrogenase XdhC/CoxF family maturation factor